MPLTLPTTQRKARLGLDDEEPTMKDVMLVLGNIKSRLAAHDARLDEMAAPDVPLANDEHELGPSHDAAGRDGHRVAVLELCDAFDGMEEEIQWKVADHL